MSNINPIANVSGIYRLYWNNCDYYYFGQAININKRFKSHICSLNKFKHKNRKVQSVFNKYGDPKIEIVKSCCIEELDNSEQEYIDNSFSDKYCCNLSPTARSSKGVKHSTETIEKYRLVRKGKYSKENNPFYGKTWTDEQRKTQSEKLKGRYKGDRNPMFGKKHTSEALCKMKGRVLSDKRRSEISENNKKVVFYEGNKYNSIKELAIFLNKAPKSIYNIIRRKGKVNGSLIEFENKIINL